MDAFVAMLRAVRENVDVNFHCWVSTTLIFFLLQNHKCSLSVPCKSADFFSVTRTYVHVQWDVREALLTHSQATRSTCFVSKSHL